MGVADFPIEIFRAVKTKNQAKEDSKIASNADANTSVPASQSQLDPGDAEEETGEPKEYDTSDTSQQASSVPSTKTSYESTAARSSVENAPAPGTPLTTTSALGEVRGGSLKEALRGTLARSRSSSRDRNPGSRSSSRTRTATEFDPSKLTLENAIGAGKGVSRIVGAGMKSPMDFTLGLARGFHNAPKLYGDDTVRPQEKVTDFQSGLRAAGKVIQV